MSSNSTSYLSSRAGNTHESGSPWEDPMHLEIPETNRNSSLRLPVSTQSMASVSSTTTTFKDTEFSHLKYNRSTTINNGAAQKENNLPNTIKDRLFPLTPLPTSDYPAPVTIINSYPANKFPNSVFPLDKFPDSGFPQINYPMSVLPHNEFPVSGFPVSYFPHSGLYPSNR